ncbi:MAG: LacI family DNA-binding transcriptional regulator [Bacteroidetes bacterium]|nr:LacI family DNA-binding transcriptional regulator [Bacteroidota bacterium]
MKNKATLKYISESLNISISTVSRALKDHPDISLATKERVKELASLIDYEPNTFAINLRNNSSKIFGVIVPAISNFFYHSFISSVEEESRKLGYSLLILQSGDDAVTEMNNIRLCKANRTDGIFIAISPESNMSIDYTRLSASGTPFIFFDKVPSLDNCNKICLADEEAAELAAAEIVSHKKKNILAIFGNRLLSISQKREAAFKRKLHECGYKYKLSNVYAGNTSDAFDRTVAAMKLKQKPDVIFAMSDEILAGVIKACQQLKIVPPSDLGLISISNDGFIPKLFNPEITYIETSGYELGKLAVKRMMECITDNSTPKELTIACRVVLGRSL